MKHDGKLTLITRIFFACDFHGSESTYLKFVNAAKLRVYKADVVIASGDLTGKAMVPIIEQENGSYQANFLGSQETIKTKEELQIFLKRVRNVGYYHEIMSKQRYEMLLANPGEQHATMSRLMLENMERWIRIAEERLAGSGVSCYLMPGNDDSAQIGEIIDKSSYAVNPEDKVIDVGEGREMISSGYSSPTPWKTPRECSEEELKAKIDRMASSLADPNDSIFNLHDPPFGSGLDTAPQLDENLRPVMSMGELLRVPVGSKAVLQSIEEYQPLLGLHGHIHESPGEVPIGRTMCLNPGSEYQCGILRGYILTFEKNKLKSWLHTET